MKKSTEALIEAMTEQRQRKGLSLRALSKIIGVDGSGLSRFERGLAVPDEKTALSILSWLEAENMPAGWEKQEVCNIRFAASRILPLEEAQLLVEIANFLKPQWQEFRDEDKSRMA